jgi:hypothetical protein
MRERAFDLLKAGDIGLESAKQLKICLAGFLKILSNLGRPAAVPYPWDGA